MSGIMGDHSTIDLLDSENVGLAVNILFLTVIDTEIPRGVFTLPQLPHIDLGM